MLDWIFKETNDKDWYWRICPHCGTKAYVFTKRRNPHCSHCGNAVLSKPKPTTRFEQIKSFTISEMAEFLLEKTVCNTCVFSRFEDCKDVDSCKSGIRKWLESEADI